MLRKYNVCLFTYLYKNVLYNNNDYIPQKGKNSGKEFHLVGYHFYKLYTDSFL